jgi:outer membrane protein assembly factor BamA
VSKVGSGDPFSWGFQSNVCVGLGDEQDSTRLDLNYNVTASLREPHFLSRRRSAVLSVFAEKRSEFQAYLREVIGGEISVTQQFGIPVTFSYSLQYGRTAADPATFCTFLNVCLADDTVFSARLLESTVGISAIRDRANSALDPSRGSRISAEVRLASTLIGSDTLAQYTRAQGQVASYHRLGRSGVFAWRVRVGTIFPPRLGFEGQKIRFVPPDERFYGGGPNSVRGFGQNQLGPLVRVLEPDGRDSVTVTDANGGEMRLPGRLRTSPTGGNLLYFANVEIRAPLPAFSGRLSGAMFVDAGQVFERGDELITFSDVRVTPGLGLRFASPLGPVRLDVAYNGYEPELGQLYRLIEATETNERRLDLIDDALRPLKGSGLFNRLQLHFSVGQAF